MKGAATCKVDERVNLYVAVEGVKVGDKVKVKANGDANDEADNDDTVNSARVDATS